MADSDRAIGVISLVCTWSYTPSITPVAHPMVDPPQNPTTPRDSYRLSVVVSSGFSTTSYTTQGHSRARSATGGQEFLVRCEPHDDTVTTEPNRRPTNEGWPPPTAAGATTTPGRRAVAHGPPAVDSPGFSTSSYRNQGHPRAPNATSSREFFVPPNHTSPRFSTRPYQRHTRGDQARPPRVR